MICDLFQCLFDTVTYAMWTFLIVLIISHAISRIHLYTKKHVKLSKESFVVITGACMGIGQ